MILLIMFLQNRDDEGLGTLGGGKNRINEILLILLIVGSLNNNDNGGGDCGDGANCNRF
ncbi:MAG: hypothetical protein LBS99_01705 [Clostridiales bacterium]|nr:hypothetical protein [Clostridiales bacterium]